MANDPFEVEYIMNAQLLQRKRGARVWKYAIKWKCEGFIQFSYEVDTHVVLQNNPTLLNEFWISTGFTPNQPELTPGAEVLPPEAYIYDRQHNARGKMVNDACDDRDHLVITVEDSEDEYPKKRHRINPTPTGEKICAQMGSSVATDTGSVGGTYIFGGSQYIASYSKQERKVGRLPEDNNPVIGRSRATDRMESQPKPTVLSYNRKTGSLESYRPTSLSSIEKPVPTPLSPVQVIGASVDTINLEDTMDTDTSGHEFSRIADKEASKLQSQGGFDFDLFIQNAAMGSDLPEYIDDEMPVRNSSLPGTDDEDLYATGPASNQADVQVNDADMSLPHINSIVQETTRVSNLLPVKSGALVTDPISNNTPKPAEYAKISNATVYAVRVKSPSPPQPQPSGFTLVLKENKLPFLIRWHNSDIISSDDLQLSLELPPIGFYSQDDILNPHVSSNWVKKELATLRLFQDNTSNISQKDCQILENDLHTKKLCIITSFIRDSDDTLLIFSSRSKKFAIELTGEPIRLFGFMGVIMAYRVTIPKRAISCLQKNL